MIMMIEQNTNYAYKLKYLGTPTFVDCYAKASKEVVWKIGKRFRE